MTYIPLPIHAANGAIVCKNSRARDAIQARVTSGTAASDAISYLLERLPDHTISRSEVEIGDDRSVGLLWRNTSAYAYVDVRDDGRVHYYFEMPGGNIEAVVPDMRHVPTQVYDAINQAAENAVQLALLPHSTGGNILILFPSYLQKNSTRVHN